MLYVLDLDDTLYLERDYVRSGFRAIHDWLVKTKEIDGFFCLAWNLFEKGIRQNIFDSVLKELNVYDAELVGFFVELYRNHVPDIQLQDDALKFLESQSPENFAIITDGYACSQKAKIKSLNLDKYVTKIVITDEWGVEFWKPNKRGFLEVQGNRSPGECVYIGDNPKKDFIAPKELGWAYSIRICRDNSLHRFDKSPEYCIDIQSFSEILG